MVTEPHFTPERILAHLRRGDDPLPHLAILSGAKERSRRLVKSLAGAKRVFSFMDYELHTGIYNDKRVAVGNGGLFGPGLHHGRPIQRNARVDRRPKQKKCRPST
jgi:hypothetical protein